MPFLKQSVTILAKHIWQNTDKSLISCFPLSPVLPLLQHYLLAVCWTWSKEGGSLWASLCTGVMLLNTQINTAAPKAAPKDNQFCKSFPQQLQLPGLLPFCKGREVHVALRMWTENNFHNFSAFNSVGWKLRVILKVVGIRTLVSFYGIFCPWWSY